jgi:regulator of replication initiation timing
MFTSINVHQQYSEADQKLRSWRKLCASSRKASLSTEDEARMAAKTLDMETACENKKKEIFDVITKLTASDYWPAVKPPDLQSLEAKFSSMKNYVSELRDSVNDLNTNFFALLKSKDKDSGATANDSGEPPLKRRRLEGEDATADTGEITLPSDALEEFEERLTSVASQLSDLRNDIYQRDAIMEDEIETRIDARLEEVDIFSDEDMNPSSDMVTAAVQAETAKGLEMVRVTNEQLGEVVQEVANLMVQSKGNDDEATRVRQENERLKAEIAQVRSDLWMLHVVSLTSLPSSSRPQQKLMLSWYNRIKKK